MDIRGKSSIRIQTELHVVDEMAQLVGSLLLVTGGFLLSSSGGSLYYK